MSGLRHEARIGTHTFFIDRMDPFTSLGTLADIQRQFAPHVVAALSPGAEKDAVVKAIAALASGTDGDSIVRLARKLLRPQFVAASINGGRDQPLDDSAIEASGMTVSDLLRLCVEVFKHNYADFWERGATLFGPAVSRMAASLASSETTSPTKA